MADLMQQARELLAAEHERDGRAGMAALLREPHDLVEDDDRSVRAIAAALRAAPDGFVMVPVDPTREMLDAGRTAVMAAKLASQKWTPRQHYEASGRSMAGIPEDVLDERGPLTKESVAVMVFGTMVAHRPQEASDA